MLQKEMIILGIDPSTATTGYGLIKKTNQGIKHISHGCIFTPSKEQFEKRLEKIFDVLQILIKKYKPDIAAVENIFFFKNEKTAFSVGQARGVILLAAIKNHLDIFEATPLEVKQAVSGYGRAEKMQVQRMVKLLLNLPEIPRPDDAADALAVAITCAHSIKKYLPKN